MLTDDDLKSVIAELAPGIARDPRVRATIRVGAIGHRAIAPAAQAQVSHTVGNVLRAVRRAAEEALRHRKIREQYADGIDLIVVSPLADGADRMIAQAGLAQGYLLGAILPFRVGDYETTFDGDAAASSAEFRGLLKAAELPVGYGILTLDGSVAPDGRDAAFTACARAVIRRSDILVAIYSDERWASHAAISAREAVEHGVAVVQIDPARPQEFVLWTQGPRAERNDADSRLDGFIRAFLAPSNAARPDMTDEMAGGGSSSASLDYRNEHVDCDIQQSCDFEYRGPFRARTVAPFWAAWCSGLNGWIDNWFRAVLNALASGDPPQDAPPAPAIASLPLDRLTVVPLAAMFLRYQRADTLAAAYSELHRSAQIVIVLLGMATVGFALIKTSSPAWSAAFAGLELACLLLALGLIWIAHRQDWLDRWLNCRLLAEVFRYSKFLLLTGQPSPFVDLRGGYAGEDGERAWTRDHVRHVLRAHRLAVPGRGSAVCAGAIALIRDYVVARCIDDQIAYHQATGPARSKFAEVLKRLSSACSMLTILCVGAKFSLALLHAGAGFVAAATAITAVNVAAVVAPAVTAAVLALRAYGEHDVVAARSAGMIANLRSERLALEKTGDLEGLGESVLRIARLLLSEVDGWRDLFADKHLE